MMVNVEKDVDDRVVEELQYLMLILMMLMMVMLKKADVGQFNICPVMLRPDVDVEKDRCFGWYRDVSTG